MTPIGLGLGARSALGYGLGVSAPGGAAVIPFYREGGAPLPVAAYRAIKAASYAASKINLANPGTDAGNGSAYPAWDATGWAFTKTSSQYLTTGITPTSKNWSYLVRFSDAPTGNEMVALGSYKDDGGSLIVVLYPTFSSSYHRYFNGTNLGVLNVTPRLTSGVMGMAGRACYLNGAADGTLPDSSPSATNIELSIGRLSAAVGQYFQGKIQALAIWNTSTDHATWMPAVSAAMAAL